MASRSRRPARSGSTSAGSRSRSTEPTHASSTCASEAVPVDTIPHRAVVAEANAIEAELTEWLAEPIGELSGELWLAADRECPGVAFVADVVRERMEAEVGLVVLATALVAPLPAGVLTRGTLYEACPSPGVSSVDVADGTPAARAPATRARRGARRRAAADVARRDARADAPERCGDPRRFAR